MNELTANLERAKWAANAVQTFADEVSGGDTSGLETLLGDLVCDLGHFADCKGFDYEAIIRKALGYWKAERVDPLGVTEPAKVSLTIDPVQLDEAGAS